MGLKPAPQQKSILEVEKEPVKAAETVVGTITGISPDHTNPSILIEASLNLKTGAGTTAATIRIRRGTTTGGTLIGKALTSQVAEAKEIGLAIMALDQPEGDFADLAYVVTLQQTAGTGEGKATGTTLTVTY